MAQADITSRIQKAKQEGFSDQQIFSTLSSDQGFSKRIAMARKEGFSDSQIANQLGLNIQVNARPAYQAVDPKKEAEKEYAKQKGKTTLWDSASLGFTEPLGATLVQGGLKLKDAITGGNSSEKFAKDYDYVRKLHERQREENNQGVDVVRFLGNVAATAPLGATVKGFQGAKVLSQAGAKVLAQNAGVGAAIGGVGFAKDSNERFANTVLGGAGGAGGAAVGEKIGQGLVKAANTVKNTKQQIFNQTELLARIDQKLDGLLNTQGISLGDLSSELQSSLRKNALKAVKAGKDLDKDVTARIALLDSLGIKGTRGQVTRDPKLWKQEAELAKIDGAGDSLRYKFVDDNAKLTNLLEEVSTNTGGNAPNPYVAMQGALDAAKDKIVSNKEYISSLYGAARKADGNDIVLDGAGFANDAITRLDNEGLISFLPANISSQIKQISENPNLFTLKKSEELIKQLNRSYKANLKVDGTGTDQSYAVGLVRDALNNRQDEAMKGLLAQGGNDAAQLYALGRQAYKENKQLIQSMPLLKDAAKIGEKEVQPDQLFNKHILGGNANEIERTMKFLESNNMQAANDIKKQVVEHIMGKAINNNGQPSPAQMAKALKEIGDQKLSAIFSPSELKRLKEINRAMHYLVSQPPHSYVNNSNSGSAVANFFLDIINKPFLRKLPILTSVKDLGDSRKAAQALNPSVIGEKIPPSQGELNLYQRLVQAGLISGANASKE